jgi:hypothetical protein
VAVVVLAVVVVVAAASVFFSVAAGAAAAATAKSLREPLTLPDVAPSASYVLSLSLAKK